MATKANILLEQFRESSNRLRMLPTWKLRLEDVTSLLTKMSEEDRDFNIAWNRVLVAAYILSPNDIRALALYAENLAAKPVYQTP